jgi:hypothetical protein
MSYVIAAPEMMTAAATDLAGIGSALSEAHMAAGPSVALVPAAADEVSGSHFAPVLRVRPGVSGVGWEGGGIARAVRADPENQRALLCRRRGCRRPVVAARRRLDGPGADPVDHPDLAHRHPVAHLERVGVHITAAASA